MTDFPNGARPRRTRAQADRTLRLADRPPASGRDDQLRTKVREAVAELDQLIREAAH